MFLTWVIRAHRTQVRGGKIGTTEDDLKEVTSLKQRSSEGFRKWQEKIIGII